MKILTQGIIRASVALTVILTIASDIYGNDIRVLILDERFPEVPAVEGSIIKIGSISGEFFIGGINYRGNIEVWKDGRGLYVINELPLEEYVRSVVLSETANGWEMEALKAQAVIARTYAAKHISRNNGSLYHLTSSTIHQLYRGDKTNKRVAYAVMKTEAEVLTYRGDIIEAFYHSTSGGRTELPEEVFGKEIPYLGSVASDSSLSPYHTWQRELGIEEIQRALGINDLKDIRIETYTETGRVREISLIKESGTVAMAAKEFRKVIGWKQLPSTWFSVRRNGNTFYFDGRGYGHGVGLCQWGSQKMAKEGMSYREILSHYYPGSVISQYEGR